MRPAWEGLRDGLGSVQSMVETSLILDALIIGLIRAGCLISRSRGQEVHVRLDDTSEGVAMLANELLQRTEFIRDLRGGMSPSIELHNHNPLEQVFSFIRALKTGDFSAMSGDTNINPRDSDGRYAPSEDGEENPQIAETIDITN